MLSKCIDKISLIIYILNMFKSRLFFTSFFVFLNLFIFHTYTNLSLNWLLPAPTFEGRVTQYFANLGIIVLIVVFNALVEFFESINFLNE